MDWLSWVYQNASTASFSLSGLVLVCFWRSVCRPAAADVAVDPAVAPSTFRDTPVVLEDLWYQEEQQRSRTEAGEVGVFAGGATTRNRWIRTQEIAEIAKETDEEEEE